MSEAQRNEVVIRKVHDGYLVELLDYPLAYTFTSQDEAKRFTEQVWKRLDHVKQANDQTFRDERDRLMKFAKMVGHPQWCPGFMTRQSELCTCGWYEIFPAALTPAAGGQG